MGPVHRTAADCHAILLVLFLMAFLTGASSHESSDHYDVLPSPQPAPFHGRIGLRTNESTSYWPKPTSPPEGAPNILLILIDDAGETTGLYHDSHS